MRMSRRSCVRGFVIVSAVALSVVSYAGVVFAAPKLWECNFCHQQYQGDFLPGQLRTAKCPAKDMKQNHFWIPKS